MTDASPEERRSGGSLRQGSGQATGSPQRLVEGRCPDGSLRQGSGQATGSPQRLVEGRCPELVEGMAQALREAGYRLTQPRLAVLQVLQENNGYLSPAEIYERGCTLYPPLGLVTVYRTLETLDRLGLVRRVHGQGNCHGYARADSASGHYLVCHRCSQVVEFPCEGMEGVIEAARQQSGFTVEEHLLELVGLCPVCQSKMKGEE